MNGLIRLLLSQWTLKLALIGGYVKNTIHDVELSKCTTLFWSISQVWYSHSNNTKITVGQTFQNLKDIKTRISNKKPTLKLNDRINDLQQDIILNQASEDQEHAIQALKGG